jgi:choline kinase
MHSDIVKGLLQHEGQNVLAVNYGKSSKEEVKFTTNSDNHIIKLGKNIPQNKAEGEFIGIAKFGKGITPHFIDALTYYSAKGDKNLFFEKAVEDILDKTPFHTFDVTLIPNIEIDFPEDLRKAEELVYPAIIAYERSLYESSK